MGCHFLLQGIFLIQELNLGLLLCRFFFFFFLNFIYWVAWGVFYLPCGMHDLQLQHVGSSSLTRD